MARLVINETKKLSGIAPEIYGHFSEHLGRCIYEGMFVGEDSQIPNEKGMRKDVVEALKELNIPVLRWPGGCFADEYHWMDGIGKKEDRKKMINTHWGGVVEDNSFGTHEFMELCSQLGCKVYVNGNLGSGSVREMSEWVEYMTFEGVSPMADLRSKNGREKPWKVDYFAVGNENWGCGGNMLPAYYGNEYRRYQTYIRQFQKDHNILKIACGPNTDDYDWTDTVLKTCFEKVPKEQHGFMDLLSLHYYVVPGPWEDKGSATDYTEAEWYTTMSKAYYMEELVQRHSGIMDKYDPEKKIGLAVDEWGCWFNVEPGTNPGFLYQQSTVRDALVAALTLNIFNKHSDRVRMACVAQIVNVLQSVILTDGEKMLKTPTYDVFHMYRYHQGADLLESSVSGCDEVGPEGEKVPRITESVSEKDGIITVTVGNLSMTESENINLQLAEKKAYEIVEAKILESGDVHDHNTFENPDKVREKEFDGCRKTEEGFSFELPAASVITLRLK
ncbi:MAG: alpha-N-arabinofuranosidase [Lachnospiraceae bacterium]|nr:alpha-N-arabinofuranosidase [Lachnospiraceae bacterium]